MAHIPQGVFKLTVRMQRDSPSIPWGFRMQGGADFANLPLSVAKVSPGSLAEEVGLQPGDIITAIGDPPNPAINWTHGESEQVIRQCLDYLVLTIQRGGTRMWEIGRTAGADMPATNNFPQVQRNSAASRISSALPGDSKYGGGPSPQYSNYSQSPAPFVQHSLDANKTDYNPVGTGHNRSARPFGGGGGGGGGYAAPAPMSPGVGGGGSPGNSSPIVHNPYNSPMGLYSSDNARQAYDAQASVLLGPGGRPAQGPSATQRAVQQQDQYGGDYGGSFGNSAGNYGQQPQQQQPSNGYQRSTSTGQTNQSYSNAPIRSVQAPQTLSSDHYQQPINQVPKCAACQSGIIGVFVRVRGQPMCVSCYKCARCGIPLKTIGHFIVEDQLYCEQHAKQLTRPGYDGFQSRTVFS